MDHITMTGEDHIPFLSTLNLFCLCLTREQLATQLAKHNEGNSLAPPPVYLIDVIDRCYAKYVFYIQTFRRLSAKS